MSVKENRTICQKMMLKSEKELYKVDIHHFIKTIVFKDTIR